MPPQDLFAQAWRTTGVGEKAVIRGYLASKYADTEYGLLSRAWIADHDGDSKTAGALYGECMQRYPKFLYCLNNAVADLSDGKQQLELAQRGMAVDPTFDNFSLVRTIYFAYADKLKDQKAADDFLATWEARYPDAFIFPFIRGLYSEFNAKDYDSAEKFYLAAAEKAPDRYELATSLAGLRLKRAIAASAGDDRKAAALTPVIEFATAHTKSHPLEAYNALMYAARVFKTDLKSRSPELYITALLVHQTDDAVSEAGNLLASQSRAMAKNFVETAYKTMPHSPAVLKLMAYFTDDAKQAQSYYEEAIANAPSPGEREETTILTAQRLFEDRLLDYEHAHQMLKGLLQQPVHADHVYAALFNDRLEAADFSVAKQYLDQEEAFRRRAGDINENYFRQINALLGYYLNNEREAQRYYEKNPFLLYWQKQFGESLRTSINFATDSDVIPPSDYGKLDDVARLLTEKGADQYSFAIEGHTDNAGPDSVNLPLSRRRAESIAHYLQTVKHIAAERLQTAGYGSRHPVASNATEAGKTQNRRVEIVPVGNLTSPQIVATAALPQSAGGETQNTEQDPGLNDVPEISTSPDGRYLAVGYDPMELWNIETGIRMKQLGFAGTRKFSPNGRYIASLSEYKFPGNLVRKTLFVDDAKTGLRIVQQPLFYGAGDLAWNPFSSKIAYLNDYGQVCIYDLHQHRRTACVATEGTLITGRILWTRDGRHILSAKAQERSIAVWDAESLKLVRTLRGVNWPHGLAETSDGRYIVCADNTRTLTVWDTNTWEARQESIPNLAHQIIPHPDKPLVMLGDFGGGAHQHGTLFDVSQRKVVASLEEGPEGARYAFSADGRKLFRSKPDEISILDAATLKQIGALTGTAFSARGGLADNKNDRYFSFDDSGVKVWDVKTGGLLHLWPEVVDRMARFADGQILATYADRKAGRTRRWILNTPTLSASELPPLRFRVDCMVIKNDLVVFGGTEFPASNRGEENGVVEVYDRKSWELRGRFQPPLVTEALEYGSIAGSRIDSLDVAPDGSAVVIVSAWMDGFGHSYTVSKEARVFDLPTGHLADRHTFTTELNGVTFSDKDNIAVTIRTGTWAVERKTDTRDAAGDQVSGESVLPLRGGARIVWSRASIRKIQPSGASVLNTNNLVDVKVFEDRNLLVALSGSNEISFYDLANLSKVVTIISKRSGQWIAYTPESEFSASPGGTDKASWSLGDRLLDFKALAGRFERPALLSDRLQHLAARPAETTPR